MCESNKYEILFYFSPTTQNKLTEIQKRIENSLPYEVTLLFLQKSEDMQNADWSSISGVILIYDNAMINDILLNQIVERIENRTSIERFIFLPKEFENNKNHFPPAFHTIRHQQHHLFFYDSYKDFSKLIEELGEQIQEFVKRKKLENKNTIINHPSFFVRLWEKTAFRTGVYLLPVFAAIVVLIIQMLPKMLTVMASNPSLQDIIKPPEMTSIWFQDDFDTLKLNTVWSSDHKFKGVHPVYATDYLKNLIFYSSDLNIRADIFHLQTQETWPINELQAFKLSFFLDKAFGTEEKGYLLARIVNAENPDLFVSCEAGPKKEQNTVSCSIQDEKSSALLVNEMPFTSGEWHDLEFVFIPSRFSFQFFLDGLFYGEVEIPSVQYWRDRDFYLVIGSSITNLENGHFSGRFDDLLLSHQR